MCTNARKVSFCVLFVVCFPLAGQAQVTENLPRFSNLAEECLRIIESTKDGFQGRALARPIADQLEAIAQEENKNGSVSKLLPILNEGAASCLAYARQISKGVIFFPANDRYVPVGFLKSFEEAERKRLEREQAAERLAAVAAEREAEEAVLAAAQAELDQERRAELAAIAAAQKAALLEQKALENEVNARIFEACKLLANRDFVDAYTNQLCVTSFKVNGLPED